MLLTTVRPTVSPETITKVTRLFNGTPGDILNELLQNARRAGASRITIDYAELDGMTHVAVSDDGCGIEDPARFLALGSSGWNQEIAQREDPAGMGVFSLAGRTILVTSRHASHKTAWSLTVPSYGWTGDVALELEEAARDIGTTISFVLPDTTAHYIERSVTRAAEFFALPVLANDVEVPRRDFLADALHITEWQGSRIGVFTGVPSYNNPSVNFHGLTVQSRFYDLAESLGGPRYFTKIEIGNTPDLQLVLPARKEFVSNSAYKALKVACERAIYEAIGNRPSHRLSFDQWKRAGELGITLPEAESKLLHWSPAVAADEDTLADHSERDADADIIIVEPFEPVIDQPLARALRDNPLRNRLVEPHTPFAGYSWYDALPRLCRASFHIAHGGGSTIIRSDGDDTSPVTENIEADRIELTFDIETAGSTVQTTIETDLAFGIDDEIWYDTIEHIRVAWTPSPSLTPDTLVDLLEAVCFCASSDSDADSWSTQHDRFLRDARKAATEILLGEDAAICGQFRDLIHRNRWLLPKGRGLVISVGAETVEVKLDTAALDV
jgi:hypothetical protein